MEESLKIEGTNRLKTGKYKPRGKLKMRFVFNIGA
jgi:hypothetical protein